MSALHERQHPTLNDGADGPSHEQESPRASTEDRATKAPYVAPLLVRHGPVQRHTLGGGSFNP
ncbi:MAG: hypothetical protein IT306_00935 [Chloroflexi bacterium]|nr:hypothetical protein [Chloroflexota bacterium]